MKKEARNIKSTILRLFCVFCVVFITTAFVLSTHALANGTSNSTLPGDINGDDQVNIMDLTLLKLILLGQDTPSDIADVDSNGIINNLDIDALLDQIFGQVSSPHGGGGGGGGGGGAVVTNQVNFELSTYMSTYGPGTTGDIFHARVKIAQTSFLYNGSFTVDYNSSILQVNNVSNVLFATTCVINMVNGTDWIDTAGQLTVFPNLSSCATNGSGVSGSGYLCDITFETKGAGTSPLTLGNGILYQSQSGNISAIAGTTWINSSVVITQYYSLNVSSEAHGTIISPSVNISWPKGTVVGINATATDSCWQFYRWEGNDTSSIFNVSASNDVIIMNNNYTISANFSIKTFALTLTANSSGGNPTPAGTGTYNCGDLVNISANTNPCYTFAGWTPIAGVDNPNAENTTVLMNATRSLTARYTVKRVTLITGSSTGGNVTTPGEAGSPYTYNCSQVVTITATPDSCWSFVNWSGTGVTAGKVANANLATTTITMDDNYSVYATFVVSSTPTLTLLADPAEGGTQTGAGTFDCGNNSPIQAIPNSCYTFVNWTPPTGVANANAASTTVSMTTDRTLTAHYAIRTFTLSVNASPPAGGNPTPAGTGTYNCSSNVSISANNNSCYNFVNWSSTGNVTVANPSATTTNVTVNGNGTVTANYAIKQYTLTTNVSPAEAAAAGCTVSGAATYNCSANATVQAYNAGRYIFDHWSDGLSGSTNPANVTMNGDTTVTANFVPIPMVYFETVGPQAVGAPFNIKVLADNVSYMAYATFDIRFNGSILSYNSINSTSIIGDGDGTGTATKGPSGDSEIVRIDVDYSSYAGTHGGDGVSGSGILCTLNFSPLAWGNSPLNFVDGQGTPVGELTLVAWEGYTPGIISPVYWEDGSVAIVP